MGTSYGVGRKYFSLLLFHDHQFWDPQDDTAWEMYGQYKPMPGGYVRTEIPDGMAARCDLFKSRWDGIKDTLPVTNNCFSCVAPGGYLYHRSKIEFDHEYGSISCWFRINANYANEFYGHKDYHITLMGWENFNGVPIKVEIRARDNTDPLTECIKIHYGPKIIQTSITKPILNDTWYEFVHTVYKDRDLYFINGTKFHEEYTGRNPATTPIKFNKLKIGAYDNWSSGGLDIDEVVVMNDFYSETDFIPGGGGPIQWIRPELLHLEELDEEKGLYFQMGSMLRFNYVLNPPSEIKSPDKLRFARTQGVPFALFKDNVRLPDSSWEGTIKEVTLLDPADIADIYTSSWILVTIVKFIPDNLKEQIQGASLFDRILHPIRITRISYWQPNHDSVRGMFNKIEWYKNNKIPRSNFDYIDKFGIEFKE